MSTEQPPGKTYTDEDNNQISPSGKWVAGILLTFFTCLSIFILIAYWPDRLPGPRESTKPLYYSQLFHIRLVGIPDTAKVDYEDGEGTRVEKTGVLPQDSLHKADTSGVATVTKAKTPATADVHKFPAENKLLHINTLLLILVACAGFLGNMIYISSSFTTYLGAGQFKRRWIMWYCIKPFTAAGLAIAIYFVFRGGFLNMSDNTTNINLYGLMTISLLTGLFTDRTTLKLKEVFDVLMKPKEERPDQLEDVKPVVEKVNPQTLTRGAETEMVLTGKNLEKQKLGIELNAVKITDAEVTDTEIKFTYTAPTDTNLKEVKLNVFNATGYLVYKTTLLLGDA